VAEVRHGIAKGLKDVVFLQIGDRIGSGILSGGVVIHGARGGAGEIADIPFPWSLHESPGELMLERHLAKQGFLERLNTSRPAASPVVRSFDALLERAAAGEPLAMQAVEKYGEQIGFLPPDWWRFWIRDDCDRRQRRVELAYSGCGAQNPGRDFPAHGGRRFAMGPAGDR
jgi:predicted NBD/HSP70 family sugar kinase